MSSSASFQRRLHCVMLSGQSLCNYVPRLGLPVLVPFIVAAEGYTAAQQATLLAAFFPGCESTRPAPRPASALRAFVCRPWCRPLLGRDI